MFNDTKGLKKNTTKALVENLQRTGFVYDDRVGKVGHLHAVVSEANVEVVLSGARKRLGFHSPCRSLH